MSNRAIEIRACTGLAEFDQIIELQRCVWRFSDLSMVSREIMIVMSKIGGQIFGAFDDGRMVGFTLAFPALRDGQPCLHSHLTGVLPEYQNYGIGRSLKLHQRADALARNIERIEWTFDPLETRNARFNILRLGAIVRRFIPDCYGPSSSPLHGSLPTDRLVAEWWLRTPRVEAAIAGEPLPMMSECRRIVVPPAVGGLKNSDPAQAARLQADLREQFEEALAQGYKVTGFELDQGRGVYLLEL